jgi:hypothetical protein
MHKDTPYVFLAVLMFGVLPSAYGSVSVTGGTLHAYAQNGTFISAPPDQPFAAPTTAVAAMVGIFLGDGTAKETVSFAGGQVSISTYTFFVTSAVASGSLSLTENTTESLLLHVNSGTVGPHYLGQISLDAVGGGNLFSRQFVPSSFLPQYDFFIPVTPGQYTFTWSDTGQSFLGQIGGGGFDISLAPALPEPSSLGLVGVAAGCLLARRRRNR